MSDIYMKSNPELDALIEGCNEPSKLHDLLKQHLRSTGVLANDPGDDYGVSLARPVPSARGEQTRPINLSSDPATEKCFRVIYPHGNDRFELYGASEADLDAKEAHIRAMFGARQ